MDTDITHRELLTFSNLTNLMWEFADLEPVEREDEDGNQYYEYPQLNDLLDPEVFARRDAEGNIEEFVYIEDIGESDIKEIEEGNREIKREEKKEGLTEMRKEAGIAMEYLEKLEAGNEEGKFLEEWEVIYGAEKSN